MMKLGAYIGEKYIYLKTAISKSIELAAVQSIEQFSVVTGRVIFHVILMIFAAIAFLCGICALGSLVYLMTESLPFTFLSMMIIILFSIGVVYLLRHYLFTYPIRYALVKGLLGGVEKDQSIEAIKSKLSLEVDDATRLLVDTSTFSNNQNARESSDGQNFGVREVITLVNLFAPRVFSRNDAFQKTLAIFEDVDHSTSDT